MSLIRWILYLSLVIGFGSSCGDQDLGLAGNSIEKKIDEEGGTVGLCQDRDEAGRCLVRGASVYVPWGSLSTGLTVGIEVLADERARTLLKKIPYGLEPASDIYMFTPHGTQFDEEKPVRITIPYEGEYDEGLSVLRLENEEDRSWEIVGIGNGTSTTAFGVDFRHYGIMVLETARFSLYLVTMEVEEGATEAALNAQND